MSGCAAARFQAGPGVRCIQGRIAPSGRVFLQGTSVPLTVRSGWSKFATVIHGSAAGSSGARCRGKNAVHVYAISPSGRRNRRKMHLSTWFPPLPWKRAAVARCPTVLWEQGLPCTVTVA